MDTVTVWLELLITVVILASLGLHEMGQEGGKGVGGRLRELKAGSRESEGDKEEGEWGRLRE